MKVMHVAECIGGVDRYLRCLLKYSNCENIMVLSQLYDENEYKKLAQCVDIMRMEHGIGLSALKEAKELRKKIKKYEPDIVYAHSSIAGAIARMACIGMRVKVIYNPHGWSFNIEGGTKRLFIILEKVMSHFCNAIICISEAEKVSALKNKICAKEKLRVIYNGIDLEEYDKKDIELSIPDDAFVVGMVGRICKQKAPDTFVKMAGIVKQNIPNASFIIVGDVIEGEYEERKAIEKLAEEYEIPLMITGWVDNPMDYMSRFDVGCLLSRWEGFGLVIPEYMLSRTAIVASKVDAIPYLIHDGEDGLLVEKDDWQMASSKVIEIFKNETLKNRIVKNGLETVKAKYDAKRVATECEKLYEELL